MILQGSVAYQSWWKNKQEIQEYDVSLISDYLLASRGWVFRLSPAYVLSKNKFSFSQLLLKPEFTYKNLQYDNKCFYNGSNGINETTRQLRSFKSHYFAFHTIIAYRHLESSYEEIPIEWFVGPGIVMAYEKMNKISEGYSGNCTDVELNEITKETRYYYSIRFGMRIGFKVFERKNKGN